MRIVHYINQFFAGIGGEDVADAAPEVREGPTGPGRALQQRLGAEHTIVATVFCGDDRAAEDPEALRQVLELVLAEQPDLLVAGPAFTSGRYGLACARLVAAARAAGLPALAAMGAENPGLEEAAGAVVVGTGETAREMRPTLERLATAIAQFAAGEPVEGRVGTVARRNVLAERSAAERALEMLAARIAGQAPAGEIPLPRFDRVTPAAPLADPGAATIALVTEGALVPAGNPDRLASARATAWLRYPLAGDGLAADGFQSVHGGFSTQWANADPNRILPLDVARELEREGEIGRLHDEYLTTVGNGTPVSVAKHFGAEWAAALLEDGVQAAILTAT